MKKVLQYAFGPIGAAALGLVTIPFVAWFFPVEDVGRLTMLQLFLNLSAVFFSLSMYQSYVREYHEVADKVILFKTSIVPGLLPLLAASLVVLLFSVPLSSYLFGIESYKLSLLVIVGTLSSYLIIFLTHVVRMQERAVAFSLTQLAPKLFLFTFIGLIFIIDIKADFTTLILMETSALFLSLLVFSWLTRDTWLPALKVSTDRKLLNIMLRFSLPLLLGSIAYKGLTAMDKLFLRSMSGLDELGIYAMATTLAASVTVISVVFSNVWHPTVYKWVKKGVDADKIQQVIECMVLFVATIWTFLGLLSWVFVCFLPEDYESIKYLVVACASMPLLYMLSETTVVGIGISRKTSYAMLASIVAFLANGVLNYFLIPKYGSSGAALATLASFFIFFVVRTESSSILWRSFPRWKIYIIVTLYSLATAVMVLTKGELPYISIMWSLLLVFTVSLFINRLIEFISFINIYILKRT